MGTWKKLALVASAAVVAGLGSFGIAEAASPNHPTTVAVISPADDVDSTTTVVTDPPTTVPDTTTTAVTDPPTTEAPATTVPVTDPPTTQPPVTDPPTTDPPTTEAPPTTVAYVSTTLSLSCGAVVAGQTHCTATVHASDGRVCDAGATYLQGDPMPHVGGNAYANLETLDPRVTSYAASFTGSPNCHGSDSNAVTLTAG